MHSSPTLSRILTLLLLLGTGLGTAQARQAATESADPLPGSVPEFEIDRSDITLARAARADTYFDKTGRRFAILGTESGAFEAWAYPIKLFRDFSFEFFIGSSTTPIRARDIVTRIDVDPHVTTLTYVFQSFTVKAHFVVAVDDPGAVILLDVDSTEPLTVVAGFIPMLSPMWPGGLGGQYAYWDGNANAYLISESSYQNHGYVGSPAGQGMSYTPAHMLSDQPNQFSIRIEDPQTVRGRFIPIVMAGGVGSRDPVLETYRRLSDDPQAVFASTRDHFESLLSGTVRIRTPVEKLNLAVEWAKVAYEGLLVDHPLFDGTGLVAGLDRSGNGGRPGFGWFFGGDAYINALSLNALGHFEASRQAIGFMTQFQREDGKMAHEISQAAGTIDWFGDYPYAYIHADTSPYFIVAVNDYFESTGDLEFVRGQYPALVRAYDWSVETDGDGDGLMDNSLAGLGALEFGALTGIQSDIYLNAVWIKATDAMRNLAEQMDDDERAGEARDRHEKSTEAFERYWSEAAGQYVYAFNEDGRLVDEITPWSAVGLMFGLGSEARAHESLLRMARSDLTSDWGVRMLSTESVYFEPLNYNYGAVWPFLTSWVTSAQYRRGLPLQAFSGLMSTVQHVFNRSLGQITEVFSGARHTWPQESVPHQGFCTAGSVLPTIRGLLGLSSTGGATRLVAAPALPGDWTWTEVEGFTLGDNSVDVRYERTADRFVMRFSGDPGNGRTVVAAPVFASGTRIERVRVNGREVPFEEELLSTLTRVRVETALADGLSIEMELTPAFEILPPIWDAPIGDESRGIRIVRLERDGETLDLEVEGPAGRTFLLDTVMSESVRDIEGAHMDGSQLVVAIPGTRGDGYTTHVIIVTLN